MTLQNIVLDSACHMGEQHCGERRDIDVAADPVATQQAQRRGGNRRGGVADPSSSTRRGSRGLLLRNGVWHIDKVLFGKRTCESTRTGNIKEAEMLLAQRVRRLGAAAPRGLVLRQAWSPGGDVVGGA